MKDVPSSPIDGTNRKSMKDEFTKDFETPNQDAAEKATSAMKSKMSKQRSEMSIMNRFCQDLLGGSNSNLDDSMFSECEKEFVTL